MQTIKSILVCFVLLAVFAADAQAVTMIWSAVGNPGNPADSTVMTDGTSGYGSVGYAYNIGTNDVTTSQYVEFLNSKDPAGANALNLYSMSMNGIRFSAANPLGTKYSVQSTVFLHPANHPMNYVTWYDTIRFANWMNNGQGSGDTETGAYTLGTLGAGAVPISPPLTHNAGAHIWLPTENEWYKAAYYDPNSSSYLRYGTGSNTVPTATTPTATPNSANYAEAIGGSAGQASDVGAYTGTMSPYGAFDMAGNANQWNETLINGSMRGLRGGGFNFQAPGLSSSSRFNDNPIDIQDFFGFRLASVINIPEPSTLVLAAFGFTALAAWGWRRRKH